MLKGSPAPQTLHRPIYYLNYFEQFELPVVVKSPSYQTNFSEHLEFDGSSLSFLSQ